MQYRNTLRARRTGSIRLGVVVILGIVIASGVFAYQHFFHRGGEEAIKLIPVDALVVGTCDLNPSPEQVPLFKRIHDALQNEHAGSHLSTLWTSAFQGSPAATELQPFHQFLPVIKYTRRSATALLSNLRIADVRQRFEQEVEQAMDVRLARAHQHVKAHLASRQES